MLTRNIRAPSVETTHLLRKQVTEPVNRRVCAHASLATLDDGFPCALGSRGWQGAPPPRPARVTPRAGPRASAPRHPHSPSRFGAAGCSHHSTDRHRELTYGPGLLLSPPRHPHPNRTLPLVFKRPSSRAALVVVSSALALAAAGTTGAAAQRLITGTDIADASVTGKDIKNGSLSGGDVRDGSITVSDLATKPAGIPGPQGPAGATGANGPAGPAGPQGARDRRVRTAAARMRSGRGPCTSPRTAPRPAPRTTTPSSCSRRGVDPRGTRIGDLGVIVSGDFSTCRDSSVRVGTVTPQGVFVEVSSASSRADSRRPTMAGRPGTGCGTPPVISPKGLRSPHRVPLPRMGQALGRTG